MCGNLRDGPGPEEQADRKHSSLEPTTTLKPQKRAGASKPQEGQTRVTASLERCEDQAQTPWREMPHQQRLALLRVNWHSMGCREKALLLKC